VNECKSLPATIRGRGDGSGMHEVAASGAVEVDVSLGGGSGRAGGDRACSPRLGGSPEPAHDVAGVAKARRRSDVGFLVRQQRGTPRAPLLRRRRLRKARPARTILGSSQGMRVGLNIKHCRRRLVL